LASILLPKASGADDTKSRMTTIWACSGIKPEHHALMNNRKLCADRRGFLDHLRPKRIVYSVRWRFTVWLLLHLMNDCLICAFSSTDFPSYNCPGHASHVSILEWWTQSNRCSRWDCYAGENDTASGRQGSRRMVTGVSAIAACTCVLYICLLCCCAMMERVTWPLLKSEFLEWAIPSKPLKLN
jgi:hypothetical protein